PLGARALGAGRAHQVGVGARDVETARDAHDGVELAVQVGAYAAAPEPGAADRAALVEVIAAHGVAAAPVSAGKGELQVTRGGRAENGTLPVDARAVPPGDAVGRDASRPPTVRRLLTGVQVRGVHVGRVVARSEEHTSELQSREKLVCRLLLEKQKHPNSWDRMARRRRLVDSARSLLITVISGARPTLPMTPASSISPASHP